MFADFQRKRDRFAIALFALALLLSGLLLSAVAYAYHRYGQSPVVEAEPEPEPEILVEFAPPEPEQEPEPIEEEPIVAPEPAAVFRPAAARPVITPPEDIPDARPEESSAELREERDTGPVGGDTRGVPGGRGGQTTAQAAPEPPAPPPPPPPPPRRREREAPQVSTESIRAGGPTFRCEEPPEVRAQGIAGVVLVQVAVDVDGSLKRMNILRGPAALQDVVRGCLRERPHWQAGSWRPAIGPDGNPLLHAWVQPFQFRARNL